MDELDVVVCGRDGAGRRDQLRVGSDRQRISECGNGGDTSVCGIDRSGSAGVYGDHRSDAEFWGGTGGAVHGDFPRRHTGDLEHDSECIFSGV